MPFKGHFGFRNNHSTNHGLISSVKLKKKCLDNNYFKCGGSTDLKKSFDTINHDILLAKLEHCGVFGQAKNWLQSFLKNQKEYMLISGYSSDVKNVLCRVPQCSKLGFFLFLVYVNDLESIFQNQQYIIL